jgi:hypothetical protein
VQARSVPVSPYRPQQLQWQVFLGHVALEEGLLTPNQLRSSAWRRLFRDVYADRRLSTGHALNCHGAALLLPDSAAISGISAAVLHGVPFAADDREPVHVSVPAEIHFGPVCGLRIHTVELPDEDIVDRHPLRVTSPPRTAWDVAAWLDTVEAVAILDGMLAKQLVTYEILAKWLAEREGVRGWRRAQTAIELADGRAQSPPESKMRVRLVLAGLPRPVPQHPVATRDGVLHPDLVWPEYLVALEYEGAYHDEPNRLELDRRRLNLLVAQGWIVLHATRQHLGRDFDRLVHQTRTALESRGWRPTTSGKSLP